MIWLAALAALVLLCIAYLWPVIEACGLTAWGWASAAVWLGVFGLVAAQGCPT